MTIKNLLNILIRSGIYDPDYQNKVQNILDEFKGKDLNPDDLTEKLEQINDPDFEEWLLEKLELLTVGDDEDDDEPSDEELEAIESELGGIEGGEPSTAVTEIGGVPVLPEPDIEYPDNSLYSRVLKQRGLLTDKGVRPYQFHAKDSKAEIVRDLVKVADSLDQKGLHKEADMLDSLIKKFIK